MEATTMNNEAALNTTTATEVKSQSKEEIALKAAHKALVDAVTSKVMAQVKTTFGKDVSEVVALEMAKDFGYIAGQKGKNGGIRAKGELKTNNGKVIATGDLFLGDAAKPLVLAIDKAQADYEASLSNHAASFSVTEQAKALGINVKGTKVKTSELLKALQAAMAQAQKAQEQAPQAEQAHKPSNKAPVKQARA